MASEQAPAPTPLSPQAAEFEMHITNQLGDQYDIVAHGNRISVIIERPWAIHGPPNPLGTHPPTAPPQPQAANGGYSLFPPASASAPPPGFKHVRFNLTEEQIHQNTRHPRRRVSESTILGTTTDDPSQSTVRFSLTASQLSRLSVSKPKLVESEILPMSAILTGRESDVNMSKTDLVRSVVGHVLKRGKGKNGGDVRVTVRGD